MADPVKNTPFKGVRGDNRIQYFLAEIKKVDCYGTIFDVRIADGPHDSPEGVTKAQYLHRDIHRIWHNHEEPTQYCMVRIEPVPDSEAPVEDEALMLTRKLMDGTR